MPDIDKIITDVIKREGEATNDPTDKGGRTQFGISERNNPEAWLDGKVTEKEAREIYEKKYVVFPGFDRIDDVKLREQLVDFGVLSGPQKAIMELQQILQVDVDGVIGPQTLDALEKDFFRIRIISNSLAVARIKMFVRIVKRDPSQLKYLAGWVNRASEFIL